MLIEKVLAKDLAKAIEATVLAARQSADRNKQEILLNVRESRLNVTGVGAQVEVDVLTGLSVQEGKEVGFNITYLLDALRQIDTERVNVCPSNGAQGFWMLKGVDKPSFAAIVMPMRL